MKALLMAFSMYSRLPVPDFVWEEEDRKKAMCFFPLIGVLAGAAFFLVYLFMERSGAGPVFKGAFLTAVPLLATGGIHMDGFLDTCDARASWGDREKKLQILKDTHAGPLQSPEAGCTCFYTAAAVRSFRSGGRQPCLLDSSCPGL